MFKSPLHTAARIWPYTPTPGFSCPLSLAPAFSLSTVFCSMCSKSHWVQKSPKSRLNRLIQKELIVFLFAPRVLQGRY